MQSSSTTAAVSVQTDALCPVWARDPREEFLDEAGKDYLFDLRGFDVISGALSHAQIVQLNEYVDAHPIERLSVGEWIGHVETHTYGATDGMNFQNIIEAGPVFESCIDHSAWYDRVRRYIAQGDHHLAIDENFLNVRRRGGFIPLHSGGNLVRLTSSFRNYAGSWMVGQINVLMALTDVSYGDGCTTVIPGSHKAFEPHPKNRDGRAWDRGVSGSDAVGMVQVHLKAGDALMFTDALTHASLPRTNQGDRRVMIYRYSPHLLAKRYNYIPSEELMARLTDQQRKMVMSQPPRLKPGRTLVGEFDSGPRDAIASRD